MTCWLSLVRYSLEPQSLPRVSILSRQRGREGAHCDISISGTAGESSWRSRMPFRRRNGSMPARCKCSSLYHLPFLGLLCISVVTSLVFFAAQNSKSGDNGFLETIPNTKQEHRKLNALQDIENVFPKEVLDEIILNSDDSGPLSLNTASRKDLSSSWVVENSMEVKYSALQEKYPVKGVEASRLDVLSVSSTEKQEVNSTSQTSEADSLEDPDMDVDVDAEADGDMEEQQPVPADFLIKEAEHASSEKLSPAWNARRQTRLERKAKRLTELMKPDEVAASKVEKEAIARGKDIISGDSVLNKYSIWRRENDENSDALVRLIRDQLIMARAYASLAQSRKEPQILRDLRLRIKESQRTLGEANVDSDLPRSASERVKSMGQMLSRAREQLYDCTAITKKLRAMLQLAEQHSRVLKKQSTFLNQLAAKTLPKGIHCLSMRLTVEYYSLPGGEHGFPEQAKLEDNSLFHYALFSDNVLAASVVVNSTVTNAKEPWKHVFHLVTDKLNYAAMKMWFLANPPGKATIDIQNIDDFFWLNSSYCPVLRQLDSAAMKEYYFKADQPTTLAAGSSNLKYRNPKYLSMLNHLRFYLPEVYPKLDKILFLDDDIVVQKDLTPLWSVNMGGNVNGAVETCGQSFHRFDKYLNFSNPHIRRNFDPHACGWAYGMNIFDLQEWKKRDITGIYHRWQSLNEDRVLWKLGTLPPGLLTFYNLTHPLNKSWHVLGLGYNPSVDRGEIEGAAVIHYNGNMKPWLELAMPKYKHYWTKFVKYNHRYLQQCNIQ